MQLFVFLVTSAFVLSLALPSPVTETSSPKKPKHPNLNPTGGPLPQRSNPPTIDYPPRTRRTLFPAGEFQDDPTGVEDEYLGIDAQGPKDDAETNARPPLDQSEGSPTDHKQKKQVGNSGCRPSLTFLAVPLTVVTTYAYFDSDVRKTRHF